MATNMINSFEFGSNIHPFSLPYGVCETAADDAAKIVTVDNFSLETGAIVIVKFTNSNSVASPTLNVNNTGAKAIMRYGTTAASSGTTTSGWVAGAVQMFVFDGTNWIRDYWNNTTYNNVGLGQGYTTCSTAAATVAKTADLSSYALTTGGIVSVKFTYDVPASATLNINSKGAKAIYHKGAAIKAGVIKAGDTATFIYSTRYHLIAIDRDYEANAKTYTDNAVAALVDSAPGTLNTLNELAAALNDDANFASTVTTEIGKKQNTITGAATTITGSNLTASRALVSDSSGKVAVSAVTSTELGYLDGVTSAIQTQLDGKAASSHNHAASNITSGTLSSDRLPAATTSVLGAVKIGSNINVSSGTISVPAASGTTAGVTIVYPEASCTTYTSDSGTVSPAAVQKGAKLFSYERLTDSAVTETAIPRFTKTAKTVNGTNYSGLESTNITIQSVTNSANQKTANVLCIPAEGGKKMVYGYCTDQVDGTSFIGGVFDASATEFPYAAGLAIGGTSGNLLWKGKRVLTTDDSYTHPTSAGNKHIPSGGSSGQILRWSASGTATWGADNNTTYTIATGDSNGQIKVTPSSGSAYNVSVKGLGSAAYTASTAYAEASHTHSYAGSSSAGGSATSAVKLDTATAGSATQPSYFANGKPAACTYSLNATVPSGAVFTDKMVEQKSSSAVNYRPLLMHGLNADAGVDPGATTGKVYYNSKISACASTGDLFATTFTGDLVGTADYADALSSAVTINGTTFQNAGDSITTAKWGTARSINIVSSDGTGGSAAVSIDGSSTSGYSLKLPATIKASLTGNVTGNCSGSSGSCTGNSATATKATQDGSGNTITSTYLKLSGGTMTGNIKTNATQKGYYLMDSTGYSYAALWNNASNLWIGATAAASQHHTGGTYISSGYNGTTGNPSIYVSIPNDTNDGATSHAVVHAGNYTDYQVDNKVQQSRSTASNWRPLLSHYTNGSQGVDPGTKTNIVYYNENIAVQYSTGTLSATKVKGAVWNDYAEYRTYKDSDEIPYGRIVVENGDDTLSLSIERLQKGGNVCSDTFGFYIGETEKAQMPIAVSGRALVYTNEDRNSYEPGDAVCTGPNGTISKMTREEIKEYPDCIIGYVSAIPEYETWGETDIPVDGRIWIKVV